MDLVVVAQIITGIATLIVALVLVFQLRQQNNQLKLQRMDFTQQIKNQIVERRTNTVLAQATNPEIAKIMQNGRYDYSTVDDDHKTFYHQMLITTLELLLMKNFYSNETGYEKSLHLRELLGSSPGGRKAYRDSTIRQQMDKESVKILDEIVREIDEEVGLDGILETKSTYPYKK